ncbi:hypothetical protein SDC9_144870 [bioreactor metagenome]|uniref:Uncharacterized protein n=1 Tax=bioreactor metagenome TaxID=1076179 RepID=A0A645EA55_9ZZZZ
MEEESQQIFPCKFRVVGELAEQGELEPVLLQIELSLKVSAHRLPAPAVPVTAHIKPFNPFCGKVLQICLHEGKTCKAMEVVVIVTDCEKEGK